ncbi:hypothetical protein ACFPRL_08880 [Pseudoclavibacter helvolus]
MHARGLGSGRRDDGGVRRRRTPCAVDVDGSTRGDPLPREPQRRRPQRRRNRPGVAAAGEHAAGGELERACATGGHRRRRGRERGDGGVLRGHARRARRGEHSTGTHRRFLRRARRLDGLPDRARQRLGRRR